MAPGLGATAVAEQPVIRAPPADRHCLKESLSTTAPVSGGSKASPWVEPDWGTHLLQEPSFGELLARHNVEVLEDEHRTPNEVLAENAVDADDAFYVADLGTVLHKVDEWKRLLPRVKPHFAVKCNPADVIVEAFAMANLGFDCASRAELKQVLDLGIAPERIIFANPCKQASSLRFVREHGVKQMTFDNPHELRKIKQHHPGAHLVIRIAVDDSQSVCRFNSKFGVHPADCAPLFELAKELELEIIGVSFHVGSGCQSAKAFGDAVASARDVFTMGQDYGFPMQMLDIGGGFPGHDDEGVVTFEEIAHTLNASLDKYFPVESGVRVIAEPGRYFVSESHLLAVNVIAKRPLSEETLDDMTPHPERKEERQDPTKTGLPEVAYYLNDGVYGSFNCVVFDHAIVYPQLMVPASSEEDKRPMRQAKLFGPTCDSMDVVMPSVLLPECHIGDWIRFPNMGAYTCAAASQFNGFAVPPRVFVMTKRQDGFR